MVLPTARAEIHAQIKKLSHMEERLTWLANNYTRKAMEAQADAMATATLREEYETILTSTEKPTTAPGSLPSRGLSG